MANYIISGCSTADLSKEHFEKRGISYICFSYTLGGKQYIDDLGQSMSFDEFYSRMAQGEETSTSQVNISDYLDYFCAMLEKGNDVIHVCLSSGLSGTYNSAVNAALVARERYPERKLYVLDSLGASSGYGLLLETMADLRDSGMGIDELYAWGEENRLNMCHRFFSTDLSSYIRGGRISKTAGFFGGLLNICPLLDMDGEGRLAPREKIRTKKKVIRRIVECMQEEAKDGLDYSGKCFISNSACPEDARAVADMVEATFPKLTGKVEIFSIGTTIGSHTGPGTVALFYWGEEKRK